MKYNFDEIIDRSNTDAVKLKRCKALFGTEDLLPLWVADMDFRTPDFILDAIKKRLEHPILGYTMQPENLHDLFIQWVKEHHRWELQRNWVGFVPGIVPALSFAVQCFTQPGDEVLVQPPVYYPFFNVVKNNGRLLKYNVLTEYDGKFEIDFEDFEQQITPQTKMFILCNPHNPGGRVWSLDSLQKIDEICARHNVLVISDEIHADMVLPGHRHVPYATVSDYAAEHSVTFMAPSKVFNMPGVVSSTFIIPNPELKRKFTHYLEVSEMNSGNLFAYVATVACYEHGEPWRLEMLNYIQQNIIFLDGFLKEHVPGVKAMIPEASFLVWLDCTALGMDTDTLHHFFAHEAGLGLNKGTIFGPGGEQHLRINVACPRSILEQALEQLKKALTS